MNRKFSIAALYLLGIGLSLLIGLVLFGPVLIWNNLPGTPLSIWIVDKTVPLPDYREHKGLMWVLNHNKVLNETTGQPLRVDKDYYGFVPSGDEAYDIRPIPGTTEYPDVIYLTDTYGVYTDDYLGSNLLVEDLTTSNGISSNGTAVNWVGSNKPAANQLGSNPSLLYGGLDHKELNNIVKNLGYGNTLISEFNIASSPTNRENRHELEMLFGNQWTGWKGRYFSNLSRGFEVPSLMVENFERQAGRPWTYRGSGYVLVSEAEQIVVLEQGKEIGPAGLTIQFDEGYDKEFNIAGVIPYSYWFEFLKADHETQTIASYHLDVTSEGEQKLADLGLTAVFPAVTRKTNKDYTAYYFGGDFADLDVVNNSWHYYGLENIKKITSQTNKGAPDYFYWNAYVPMMTKIMADVKIAKQGRELIQPEKMPYVAKVEGKDYYVYEKGQWVKRFLKGVNLGAGKPGAFPGDMAITKAEYLRWFGYISEMNAEVLRVYTTLEPSFYEALALYNKSAERPLYLIQGVWVKEEDIAELKDAYGDGGRILNAFSKDSYDLVDILHGQASLPEQKGFASGEYTSDVSEYVIGWILGIEWDPEFVHGTNQANSDKTSFAGEYLYTSGTSAFEAFLCQVGDAVIKYETDKYSTQRPVSFSNWPTTDMLSHPNEPFEQEDLVSVNMEHIKAHPKFEPGLFASYHIYPYYPEFMNYQAEYAKFKDEAGKINPYKAYLRDLMKEHTMPVLVAEFGIPASRGNTHSNVQMGYDQGHHDETDQGIILEQLLQDIYDEGYCGGLVFAWQDEWFKRTWNTMDFDAPERRPFWSNPQTSEQEFGLLAFDPGTESICNIDGNVADWANDVPISSDDGVKLYVKSDEKYVYLLAETDQFDFNRDTLVIPIDTIDDQGNLIDVSDSTTFSRGADFVVKINGKTNSRILVDAYYDSFQHLYGEQLGMVELDPQHKVRASGVFNPMELCLSKELLLPQDQTIVPFSKYETGRLQYGNGNPTDPDFNSLTDFIEKDGKLEIRIPWQLLNVMDPSTKTVMGDLHQTQQLTHHRVDQFYFGAGILKANQATGLIEMNPYAWEEWEQPTFHERLKLSYFILQKAFERLK